ncbi:13346_t:CDS:1 [Cetraspora pellucida]|uniref:13346_t:CDS:1 n=1 Tax=Cetraspora pellucida TaxID=1433469 RepID=A0ACA9NFA8_9GLOM|nr:13346_t:CDS:1 [Cetraspora pellucida]
MASKMFMGDMPELMENILDNFKYELDSLYSCALVSRHWCKISIPILWQNPFRFVRKPLFISRYFSSIDEYEKFVLKESGITEFSTTLFNYARLLKVLDLSYLENKVEDWLDVHFGSKLYNNSLKYKMFNVLFKLFIESGATLHKLYLYFSEFIEIKQEIFYSLGRNEQFFSQLQDLSLGLVSDFSMESATTLLRILAKNTTKLKFLKIDEFDPDYEPQLCHALICIINSQEHLREFMLGGVVEMPSEFYGIVSALESQKQTLREVAIEWCDYSAEFEVLRNCKNLEILCIRYCTQGLMKMLDYKISTFEVIDDQIDASGIMSILKKSGTSLRKLRLNPDVEITQNEPIPGESLLLETLKSFCPNITHLNITSMEFSTNLLEFIGNLQKLQFLTLRHLRFVDNIPEEERVIQFAEILPLSLQYLDLSHSLNSYVDIFFNHFNAPIKRLLINNILDNKKTAEALIEFCKRNRTFIYLGVNNIFDLDDNIKCEVEEYVTLLPCYRILAD